MAKTRSPKIHLKVLVSLADYEFIPGNEGHCPIANALKIDADVLAPRVTDKQIAFSRRSDQNRYVYRTPIAAVRFIHAVDEILQSRKVPPDFQLVLTDADLVRVTPRTRISHDESLRQAHTQHDVVRVQGGKVLVEERQSKKAMGPRPQRLNAVPA